jgi:DNA polymerase elongation subunit (family B)
MKSKEELLAEYLKNGGAIKKYPTQVSTYEKAPSGASNLYEKKTREEKLKKHFNSNLPFSKQYEISKALKMEYLEKLRGLE